MEPEGYWFESSRGSFPGSALTQLDNLAPIRSFRLGAFCIPEQL